MSGSRILVVDDEPGMVRLVALYLNQAGFEVHSEGSGAAALAAIERIKPDLVVLDVGLPDVDGFAVARQIRASSDTKVVMLTARSEPRDRIQGLEEGADDYVSKPFHPDELVARVRAVLRRGPGPGQRLSSRLEANGLVLDTDQRTVVLDGAARELRPKEFDLLAELMKRPGHVFTREALLQSVWGYEYYGDAATVDVHVWRVRAKLGESRRAARFIHTVWGVGYTFKVDNLGA